MASDPSDSLYREKKAAVSAAAIDGGDIQALNKLSAEGKSASATRGNDS